jgi:hypothetical protein
MLDPHSLGSGGLLDFSHDRLHLCHGGTDVRLRWALENCGAFIVLKPTSIENPFWRARA